MSKKNKKHKQPTPLPQPYKPPIQIMLPGLRNAESEKRDAMRARYRAKLVAMPTYQWYTVARIVKNDINLALDYGRGEWSDSIY